MALKKSFQKCLHRCDEIGLMSKLISEIQHIGSQFISAAILSIRGLRYIVQEHLQKGQIMSPIYYNLFLIYIDQTICSISCNDTVWVKMYVPFIFFIIYCKFSYTQDTHTASHYDCGLSVAAPPPFLFASAVGLCPCCVTCSAHTDSLSSV